MRGREESKKETKGGQSENLGSQKDRERGREKKKEIWREGEGGRYIEREKDRLRQLCASSDSTSGWSSGKPIARCSETIHDSKAEKSNELLTPHSQQRSWAHRQGLGPPSLAARVSWASDLITSSKAENPDKLSTSLVICLPY